MRVAVTGGAGFVGRRFVRRFLNDGWDVTIIDNLSTGLPLVRWAAFLQPTEDQRELRLTFHACDLREFVKQHKAGAFDLVIHLAAVVGGRLKIEGDPLAVATDLAIDSDFWNWIVRNPPKKVIYFSSSAVYPVESQQRDRSCPLSEGFVDFTRNRLSLPDMTYGFAKLTGEYLAKFAVEKYGLDVVIYRPFSGYGADQSLDYPFPSIIKRVVERQDPITIWGSGDQVRDFIYIEDVVDIVMATYDKLHPGEALNLGSGIGTSFHELADMTCLVLGHKAEIVNDPTKPEGVFHRVADTYKMLKFAKPTVSLEEGIERVADYIRHGMKLDRVSSLT